LKRSQFFPSVWLPDALAFGGFHKATEWGGLQDRRGFTFVSKCADLIPTPRRATMGSGRARNRNTGLPGEFPVRLLGLAAVSSATAFALTGIFAFATGVTSLAAALTFAGVLSFAGVSALVRQGLERDSGLSWCAGCIGANRERPGHKPGHRGARDECFRCFHLVLVLLLLSSSICGSNPLRSA
jgi:hypothetical protein